MNKQIAAYMRVSTDKQDEKTQYDNILKILPEGIPVKWYIDHAITGTSSKRAIRPGYDQLLRDVEAGTISAIYCYDWSRLWRNMIEQSRATDYFVKMNFPVYSVRSGNLLDERDLFFVSLSGCFNENEARQTKKKTIDGIKTKQKEVANSLLNALRSGLQYDDIPKNEIWGNRWDAKRPKA